MSEEKDNMDGAKPSIDSSETAKYQTTSFQNRLPVVPAACAACRSKHLKCDGENPCSRCATHRIECVYVRSRRGYKGPRKNKIVNPTNLIPHRRTSCPLVTFAFSVGEGLSKVGSSIASLSSEDLTVAAAPSPGVSQQQQLIASQSGSDPDLRERCLEAYFYYFAAAHPFLLPRNHLFIELTSKPLSHLEAAMRYVGSFYIPAAPTKVIEHEVHQLLANAPRDGYAVQALLIMAIALDADNQHVKSLDRIERAQNIALEIGMNQREFALMHGQGSPVLEESWRRTWWELYVVEGMISGVHNRSSFRLWDTPCSTLLPCEEFEYHSGLIPPLHSYEDYEDDSFNDEPTSFSSYTYRIAAIKNMGRMLQLQDVVFSDDPRIHQIDAHLVNWGLHLPNSKKLGVDAQGAVDEMMFQAQMITSASTIMLHKPHSQLDTTPTMPITSCGPQRRLEGNQKYNTHASKTLSAATTISQLIALPVPLHKHTHFFTCVITSSSIVHLSCWASLPPIPQSLLPQLDSQDENLKQQIKLNSGALKVMGEVWPCAKRVMEQVRAVAGEVLKVRKRRLEEAEGWWRDLEWSDEDLVRCIGEDEAIVNGFQLP